MPVKHAAFVPQGAELSERLYPSVVLKPAAVGALQDATGPSALTGIISRVKHFSYVADISPEESRLDVVVCLRNI